MSDCIMKLTAAVFIAALAFSPTISEAEQLVDHRVEVDLELVLAADRSASMTRLMLVKQRRGIAAAFRDGGLRRTIKSGPLGRIAAVYLEWSGEYEQQVAVPWTLLETAEDFEQFASAIDSIAIGRPNGETALGAAVLYAQRLFETNRYIASRKVIDISGNGRNSEGPTVRKALETRPTELLTINGLVLPEPGKATDDRSLSDYFWREIVVGPGAFVIDVATRRGFAEAILQKLKHEVAWVSPTNIE